MRWFENPSFDFVKKFNLFFFISSIVILVSIATITFQGLNYGIDFKGGQEILAAFSTPISPTEVRLTLAPSLTNSPEVKTFENDRQLLIRTDDPRTLDKLRQSIASTLKEDYPNQFIDLLKSQSISARFSEDLRRQALWAIIIAIIVIFFYIMIRFKNWKFSLGAVLALVHDVIIVLGMLTILSSIGVRIPIDQNIIAALLVIVGYSLNDTVVVFDRIREKTRKNKSENYRQIINQSLNGTLSRTIITSITTLIVVTILLLFGGDVLFGLSLSLFSGVILGTYSSLFIATSLVWVLTEKTVGKKNN